MHATLNQFKMWDNPPLLFGYNFQHNIDVMKCRKDLDHSTRIQSSCRGSRHSNILENSYRIPDRRKFLLF